MVFSGILNTYGKIGDLFINSKAYFDFIAPDFYEVKYVGITRDWLKYQAWQLNRFRKQSFNFTKTLLLFPKNKLEFRIGFQRKLL